MSKTSTLLSDALPRWAVVAQQLAADIAEGRLKVGETLPSELELCRTFNVSRGPVRQALRRLRDLGLVSGSKGRGTEVISDRPRSEYEMVLRSTADVMGYAERTELSFHGQDRVKLEDGLAEEFGADAGVEFIRLRGVRRAASARGEALACSSIYVPLLFATVLQRPELGQVPIYRLIDQELGVRLDEIRQHVTAVTVSDEDAALLGVPPRSPGLRIVRLFLGAEGQLLEATVNIHPAERFRYSIRLVAMEQGDAAPGSRAAG
ncbi:GntR family transcriptional regulator [Teichococcus oryzae]|uniref:GntR family transcriptional regulator n=1 Tax=Teichococcus oryzae TaxID=1608942 RepID=UPI0013757A61|nr:GntR family transcriptional regulator [Pseudoroseomonas oryzae]